MFDREVPNKVANPLKGYQFDLHLTLEKGKTFERLIVQYLSILKLNTECSSLIWINPVARDDSINSSRLK